jgi:hypothetical protein
MTSTQPLHLDVDSIGGPDLQPTPEELAALSRYLLQQKQARLAAKTTKTRRKKVA